MMLLQLPQKFCLCQAVTQSASTVGTRSTFMVRINGGYDQILPSHMVSDMSIPEIHSSICVVWINGFWPPIITIRHSGSSPTQETTRTIGCPGLGLIGIHKLAIKVELVF